jgi:hypothetical protein
MERLQYSISRQVELEIEQYIARHNRGGADINTINKEIEYLDETIAIMITNYGR